MSLGGAALMAVGHGEGEDRAQDAATKALASPLLDVTIDGARGILFNVTGGPDLGLYEINQALEEQPNLGSHYLGVHGTEPQF